MGVYEKMTALADAIRSKTGGTDKLSIDGMTEAVNGISAGGGDIDALIDGSITEVTSNAESVRLRCCFELKELKKINLPLATEIGDYAFQNCSALQVMFIPNVKKIGKYAFSGCGFTDIYIDVETILSNAFQYCYELKKSILVSTKYIMGSMFNTCTNLETVDLYLPVYLYENCFSNCYNLKSVIIRSENICGLININAFNSCYRILGVANNTYNPNGDKDGYIYVPRALIEDYKVATNWVTYASQFRALEDYTVDGTITGELDLNKI